MMDAAQAARAAVDYSTEPRVSFFADPDVERVLGITMAVAQEVGVAMERIDTLERLLVAKGMLMDGELRSYVPNEAVAAERLSMQQAFVIRLLRVVEQEVNALRSSERPVGG